jgi:hypothetical protein
VNLPESRNRLLLICCLLGVLSIVLLIGACGPAAPAAPPVPTESVATGVPAAVPSPTMVAAVPSPTVVAPTPIVTSVPVTAELQALVVAGLPPTPTPDPSDGGWGKVDVAILPLDVPASSPPLWVAYSVGLGYSDAMQGHFVAIYTYDNGAWQELSRVVFTDCADYVDPSSLTQVPVEPSRVWLELRSFAGAHSGCYDLMSFDGETLRIEAAGFNSSPWAGNLADLNGDGILEVVLNQTENYVFCYACSVRLPMFQILRWDGQQMVPLSLTPLPETAPADLRQLNDRAVELAQAELWQEAQATIAAANAAGSAADSAADTQAPESQSTVAWNAILIDLVAEARAEQALTGIYPLLQNVFYGDYAAALDGMRPYSPPEIWSLESPLVVGTVAEGWEMALSDWISWTTNLALGAEPDLAPAYFLRGWAAYLVNPDDPAVLADVQRATDLAPGEPLFAQSLAYLSGSSPVESSPLPVGFQPLAGDACYALGQAMMQTLYVTVTLTNVPFVDYIGDGTGTGCQAVATGTGANFGSVPAVAGSLTTMLDERGWTEDIQYAAGGPTGEASAFRQDAKLCLLSVEWQPAPDVQCPQDQPISACNLTPEQQRYTISLNCAQETHSTPPLAAASPTPAATLAAKPKPTATATSILPATEQWEVRSLLAGPGEPGRLYVLLADTATSAWPAERVRLLISNDYGQTWSPFSGSLPAAGCVRSVNLDYAAVDALYASTCQGLYRWSGSGWVLISPQETGMVAIVYGQPNVMWATNVFASNSAVLRSDDGGRTWTPAGSGLVHFNGVANLGIDPRDSNTLYAIIWPKYAGSYLRRGTASGQWQTMPTPQNNSVVDTGITIDGATGALYVVVTSPHAQLWRALDPNVPDVNAVQWEIVHDFGRDVQVELLASGWSPDGLALYANFWPLTWLDASSAEVGAPLLHRSLDGGQNWAPLPLP